MTGTSSSAPRALPGWALFALAGAAWAVRAGPLFWRGGAWGFPVDYDEGVYFTAASLLWDGVFPWRDFVFVHPPGILAWLLVPSGLGHFWLGPADGFAVARWLSPLLGAASVALAARLAGRRGGPVAALVAGGAQALYPELVIAEHGVFLEPVLNLCCLGMATALDLAEERPAGAARWTFVAGALAGLALSVKLWAVVWVGAATWVLLSRAGSRALVRFGVAAAAAAGLVLLPALLAEPRAFFEQTLRFHALRPPDGPAGALDRLGEIFHWRHFGSGLLALVGFAVTRQRLFQLAWLGTIALFLFARTFWNQYNAHLAPAEAILAGLGAAWLYARLEQRPRALRLAAAVLLCGALVPSAVHTARTYGRRAKELERKNAELAALVSDLRAWASQKDRVCAFEPAWLLAADRLVPHGAGLVPMVDSYALGLLDATRSGRSFADAAQAFDDPLSQRTVARALAGCDVVVLGPRGRVQLAAAQEEELLTRWRALTPEGAALDAYRRPSRGP